MELAYNEIRLEPRIVIDRLAAGAASLTCLYALRCSSGFSAARVARGSIVRFLEGPRD